MREEDLREEYDFGLKPCCEFAIERHTRSLEMQVENMTNAAILAIKILEDVVGDPESGLEDFRAAIERALAAMED